MQPAAASIVAALALAWPIARLQGATVVPSSIAGVSSLVGLLVAGTAIWRSARTLSAARGVIADLATGRGHAAALGGLGVAASTPAIERSAAEPGAAVW